MTKTIATLVSAIVLLSTTASAQVPPHAPGTVCLTPDFWCWATEQGIPGQPCTCPQDDGPDVPGVYG